MTQNQTQATESANKKISTYLTMIVLIVMALAVTALFIAVETYFGRRSISCRCLSRHRLNRIDTFSVLTLPIKAAVSQSKN